MHYKAFQTLNQIGQGIQQGGSIDLMKQGCQRIYFLRQTFYFAPKYIKFNLATALNNGLVAATEDLLKIYPLQDGEMKQEVLSVKMEDRQFDIFSQFRHENTDLYALFKTLRNMVNENFSQFERDMKSHFGQKITCNNKIDKSRGSVGLKRVTEKFCEDQLMDQLQDKTSLNIDRNYDLNNKSKSDAVKAILKGIHAGQISAFPLNVYDIYRCKILYDSIQELNQALSQLQQKYTILRIKNKTGTSLSQVLVNFMYEIQIPADKRAIYRIKTDKIYIVAEVQMIIKRPGYDNPIRAFNHKLYEINRAGQSAMSIVTQIAEDVWEY
eukprot:403333032